MERTTKIEGKTPEILEEEVKIDKEAPPVFNTYKKMGGGSFRFKIDGKDRIIKPNEVFKARPEDIPPAFKDSIELLGKDTTQVPKPIITSIYKIVSEDGENWYVVDSLGKRVNEKPLTKDSAYTMIRDLER